MKKLVSSKNLVFFSCNPVAFILYISFQLIEIHMESFFDYALQDGSKVYRFQNYGALHSFAYDEFIARIHIEPGYLVSSKHDPALFIKFHR